MAKLLKLRRGTTTQHGSFTGAEGEVTIDTDKDVPVVHDGSTQGGHPVAAEDLSNVSSATIAGRLNNDSLATSKLAAGALPTDVTIADANISGNLTIANADVNSDAAIAGTKVTPAFGSQNISTTGNLSCVGANIDNQIIINGATPQIQFVESDANPDYTINGSGGVFQIIDATNTSTKFSISGGEVISDAKLNCQAGLDTDGDVKFNSGTTNMNILFDASEKSLEFDDSVKATFGFDKDLQIYHDGHSRITDTGTGALLLETDGGSIQLNKGTSENMIVATVDGKVELFHDGTGKIETQSTGIGVSGNIAVTGTVDGVDIAALNTTVGNLSLSGSTLANGTTATTQSAGDNSTKVATTAYADTAVSNLVDSAPGALNTLNELAAALGDDANFSTTITNSIATKMPLSGGTFTGDATFSGGAGAITISGGSDIRFNDNTSWTGEDSGKIQFYSNGWYFQASASHHFRNASGTNVCVIDSSGNLTAQGNVTAYSDARLKTDISTINDALGICGKLRGVSYKWLKDDTAGIGVIAQEVEKVVPEVVFTHDLVDPATGETTEVKSVNYGTMVGVLINAINELKAEVDALKGGS